MCYIKIIVICTGEAIQINTAVMQAAGMCEISIHVFRLHCWLPGNQRVGTVRIILIILLNCMHSIRNITQDLLSQLLLLLLMKELK